MHCIKLMVWYVYYYTHLFNTKIFITVSKPHFSVTEKKAIKSKKTNTSNLSQTEKKTHLCVAIGAYRVFWDARYLNGGLDVGITAPGHYLTATQLPVEKQ